MVFSNAVFLFAFLPVTIGVYFLLEWLDRRVGKNGGLKAETWNLRNYWLLMVSIVFYAWTKPEFTVILIASILLNYFGAFLIDVSEKTWKRKVALGGTVFLNLALLFYFKYFNLTMNTINKFLSPGNQISFVEVALPIGISFFTFQGLSYVVDVYRGTVPAQKRLSNLAMYVSMFPQLIAGPIVRYSDINSEVGCRHTTLSDFAQGAERFIIGLFKKVMIADTMALVADPIFATPTTELSVSALWVGILAYAMQIFFDFSGYSDMAIGLGRIFGFHFVENFNYPYISKTITEFWRRWHISLSSFFRDYVYIPLGGNKKHVYLNIAIVFLLTGIWHGAAYTFIAWGIWHGMFNITEKLLKNYVAPKLTWRPGKVLSAILGGLQHLYALFVVLIGWVLFRVDGLHNATNYIMSMFGGGTNQALYTARWFVNNQALFIFALAILMSTPLLKYACDKVSGILPETLYSVLKYVLLLLLLLLCVMAVASNTYSAFIYFQF